MRKWIKFLGPMLVFILALPLASAQELELYINKHTFEPGDKINVTANILNPLSEELIFRSILFYEGKGGDFPPITQSFMVSRLEEKIIELYSIEVKDDLPSGKYSVIASLVQNENELVSKNLTFEIINTKPSFEFEVMLCRDKDCFNKSKVFVKGEPVYLDYTSEVSTPKVNAILTHPDMSREQITLPTSIKLDEVGTYTLTVTASKEGYKNVTKTVQFAVIEKEPEFEVLTTTTSLPSTTTTVPSTSTLETVTTTETQPIRFPKLSPALIGLIGAIVSVVIIVLVVYVVVRG